MSESMVGLLFVVAMLSGVFVIFLAMRQRSGHLERLHRERMAMIERGQVPAPAPPGSRNLAAQSRSMSIGIVVVGLGMALMTMIGVAAGAPDIGIGIGGAIVIVGASFIARSLIVKGAAPSHHVPVPPPPPDAA